MPATSALAQPSTSCARAASTRAASTAPVAKRPQRALAAEAFERDQLLDRLGSLRRVLPVLAQEMAAARRQAAHLRIDNRRLADQVRELRAQLRAREGSPR